MAVLREITTFVKKIESDTIETTYDITQQVRTFMPGMPHVYIDLGGQDVEIPWSPELRLNQEIIITISTRES